MSDKVYIVTDGDYSSYHIVKVFKDRETAYKYANTINAYVEEFDFSDDTVNINLQNMEEYTIYKLHYNRYKTRSENNKIKIMDLSTWINSDGDFFQEEHNVIEEIKEELHSMEIKRNSILDTYSNFSINEESSFKDVYMDGYCLKFVKVFYEKPYLSIDEWKNEYEKYIRDIFFKCINLIEEHGWSTTMVDEWVKDNYPISKLT